MKWDAISMLLLSEALFMDKGTRQEFRSITAARGEKKKLASSQVLEYNMACRREGVGRPNQPIDDEFPQLDDGMFVYRSNHCFLDLLAVHTKHAAKQHYEW
eukprot:CAMPEP_0114333858 /NCGR_PEP_ID=MMETSP0101-20121206/4018_1 /TAXON_ID=38822 ORGANISM="Pteridomonas danica, Strain PT" /NCGR_SAMPLE_ID=MMETSP0101 /ASSEMBLY_ACC=CAM_ASM_000211 /LENGTH=100 /DNA_ID=CAMNT_0001464983 /DNA_START=503 /DNA_END=803 /DNA_ORIENTATION=+